MCNILLAFCDLVHVTHAWKPWLECQKCQKTKFLQSGHSKGLGDAIVIAAVDAHKYQDLSDDGFEDLDEEVSH